MTEARPPAVSLSVHVPDHVSGEDLRARIDDLRALGAARLDPVGWRVIEAMLRRLDGFDGAAQTALARKIERRLATFRERFERASSAASSKRSGEAMCLSGAADARRAACEGTDPVESNGISGHPQAGAGRVQQARGMLAELLEHVGRQSGIPSGVGDAAPVGSIVAPVAELKSLRYFRSTWSRLSLEQQLSGALAQAPDNAGPLNSHFLVLQALIRMRDIAPSYLEGFIAHAQALLWLEQADGGRGVASRGAGQKAVARKGDARPQGGRGRKRGG